MSRWRIGVVLFLIAVPFTGMAGVGTYYLWRDSLGFIAWWPMAACMALGYLLGWYWQHKQQLLKPVDFASPMHWTARDEEAKKLVEARARAATQLKVDKLSDLNFYLETAKVMAVELAQFYHHGARDAVGALTIPEVLAVVELAAHDLSERVDRYLPGGHLLTINDWWHAKQAADWAPAASNAYWVASALLDPLGAGVRFVAARLGMTAPQERLQQYLLLWFYTAFVERTGTYLIEVNSGRLKIGAQRYRELIQARAAAVATSEEARKANGQARAAPTTGAAPPVDPAEEVLQVTVTVLGQVKMGKSSLVNALLGERRAATDVLPTTDGISRYELRTPGIATRLDLLDTVGYAHTGPREDQLRTTREAAQKSDLLILVLHARNPGRQADLEMLQGLRSWFDSRPDLKRPRLLAVVTHIDLLSPALEWSPPYNWQQPTQPKEHNIQQALAAAHEQLGTYLDGIVPVCASEGKVYGVEEWLLPELTGLLDEAHAVALLRCLKAEFDTKKVRKVFRQLLAAGKEALKVAWKGLPR